MTQQKNSTIIRFLIFFPILCLCAFPFISAAHTLSSLSGSFVFTNPGNNPITVYYHKPTKAGRQSPIVFVMTGLERNGQAYRDSWINHAERGNFIVLIPEFSKKNYPSSSDYNLGNVFASNGQQNDASKWTFSVIEQIFDKVRLDNGLDCTEYYLYGHSAGAQFVHRFIMYKTDARVKLAIAANAGWYTFPTFTVDFPYGLRNSGLNEEKIKKAFSKKLFILLGNQDNDSHHQNLRKTPQANAQGKHRLERGYAFFQAGKGQAAKMKVDYLWELKEVPFVGHSNKKMSQAAANLIIEDMKQN